MEKKDSKINIGRIGVLMGGESSEREISLKSGEAVYHALLQEGYDTIGIDIVEDPQWILNTIKENGVSMVFIVLHGKFGEDGTIQQILEEAHIPYAGSGVRASRLGMDKIASREVFEKMGIAVPRYIVIDGNSKFEIRNSKFLSMNCGRQSKHTSDSELRFPMVVKPSSHGSSVGLTFVEREEDLSKAVELASRYDRRVIIEEYVKGREVTVGILEDRPLPVIEIIPSRKLFDYRAKYEKGITEYIIPASLPEKIYKEAQEVGLRAHMALGCRSFSRVDMIESKKGETVVLEVNTIPGLTPISLLPRAAKADGISFPQLCVRMITSSVTEKVLKVEEDHEVSI